MDLKYPTNIYYKVMLEQWQRLLYLEKKTHRDINKLIAVEIKHAQELYDVVKAMQYGSEEAEFALNKISDDYIAALDKLKEYL